ncbi:MAG: primosomal protein N' [Pseudomonadales bacterium]|nr:primosomal protein N' [Pseudomonadales bacterium]
MPVATQSRPVAKQVESQVPALLLRVAVPSPLRRCFDYLPPESLAPAAAARLQAGIRVRVPFGKRELVGVLLATGHNSHIEPKKLKRVCAILDEEPLLPAHLLALYQWAAAYYQHPVGEVFNTLLPVALRQGKPAQIKLRKNDPKPGMDSQQSTRMDNPVPNQEQQTAIDTLHANLGRFTCCLLEGVTGSGKTEVYLQLIAAVLARGQQALVLVPEISLTPQTISRFAGRFNCLIAVLHSGLTARTRLNAWLQAGNGEAGIVIGTRSAIFTPMQKPGILIIDEEHDSSFKQQDGLRYSARDLGIMRAQREQIPVVLGSATPSLESLHNACAGRYLHLQLHERPAASKTARYHLLDINGITLQEGFSPLLFDMIGQHLRQGNQVLVYINRRGFAPTLYCGDCGWLAECRDCDSRLTLHRTPPSLRCHHCEARHPILPHCPRCQSRNLLTLGLGTERSESLLQSLFPDTPVIRIDRDSTRRKNELNTLLERVHSGTPCILTGTQMLAKGHHFPGVSLVAIIDADSGLFSPDFRGQEHMAQTLIQVAGRAGRAEAPGEVIIQTQHATHEVLQTLVHQGYHTFALKLLQERELADMPPFSHLVLLRAESSNSSNPERFLNKARQILHRLCRETDTAGLMLIGPLPSPMERRAGKYRAQLLLKSRHRGRLQAMLTPLCAALETLKESRLVRWSIDVDPQDMI